MSGVLIGLVVGLLIAGSVAIRGERVRVARRDLEAAKAAVKTARDIFWRAVGALLSAAAVPLAVAAVLVALYLIGERS